MNFPLKTPAFLALTALAACLAVAGHAPGAHADLKIQDVLAGQEAGGDSASSVSASQRLHRTQSAYLCDYGFTDFNQDSWNIHFSLDRAGLAKYERNFGYTQSDLNLIAAWKKQALLAGMSAQKAQAGYKRKLSKYFASRGFETVGPQTVEVNMPALVQNNAPAVQSVAEIFQSVGNQKGYRSWDLIGAASAMIQTAMRYQEVPETYSGRDIGGVLPPLQTLAEGWGDCDTKSGLLAAILKNWPQARMVGVRASDHYFTGILSIPQPGDYYVQYGGLNYVLIEAAGPAWLPPGSVFEYTASILRSDDYKIEPFF